MQNTCWPTVQVHYMTVVSPVFNKIRQLCRQPTNVHSPLFSERRMHRHPEAQAEGNRSWPTRPVSCKRCSAAVRRPKHADSCRSRRAAGCRPNRAAGCRPKRAASCRSRRAASSRPKRAASSRRCSAASSCICCRWGPQVNLRPSLVRHPACWRRLAASTADRILAWRLHIWLCASLLSHLVPGQSCCWVTSWIMLGMC